MNEIGINRKESIFYIEKIVSDTLFYDLFSEDMNKQKKEIYLNNKSTKLFNKNDAQCIKLNF